MLCYYDYHTSHGGRNFQIYLLFKCSINNNLWYNILGEYTHSNIFKIQKWIIQIITKSRFRDSCRQVFKKLENLPVHSQYIFSLLLFVVKYTQLIKKFIALIQDTKQICIFQWPIWLHLKGSLFFWNKVI
jgi:hypothetical protein